MRLLLILILGLLASLPASGARAFTPCTAANYLGYFIDGLAPQECRDLGHFDIVTRTGPSTLRLIRLAATPAGDDTAMLGYAEQLSIALGPAFNSIGTAAPPRYITILLSDQTDSFALDGRTVQTHAEATALIGSECTVTVYKLTAGTRIEDFIFTLAHELFHCAQYNTWDAAMAEGSDEWWSEGSAEYFAHLTLPGYNTRNGWFDAFDRSSLTQSLTGMRYENVVFFLWIATETGPEGVGRFLTQMRLGDQTAVLQSLISADDWTRFIEGWLGGRIQLPGGFALQPQIYGLSEKRFSDPDSLDMPTAAFVIPRWSASFAEDKIFTLTLDPPSPPPTARMRLDGTEDWTPPPEKINTCEGEKAYILYAATTETDATATLTVETDEDTTGGTCCLIGAWSPTQETLDGFAATAMQIGASQLAAAGGNLSCGYASGGWVLTFTDAANGSLDFRDNTNICTVSGRGGAMRFEESRSGSIGFDWSVAGPGAGMATYTENTLGWSIAIHIGPVVQNQSGPDAGPSRASNGFAFTCDKDALTIQGLYGTSTAEATYLRFAE